LLLPNGWFQAMALAKPLDVRPTAQRARVLVVDDDDGLRRACSRVLERAGFEVSIATNGEQALELMDRNRYDVLVSDICMPRLGGTELLRAVRERDLDIPVLLMTGSPDLSTAVDALEHGALRYLVKPFSPDALSAAVTEAARLHQLAVLKREAVAMVGDELLRFGDRAGLEASFDRALASLWMAFQPLVSLSERKVYAYEALMRTEEPLLPHPGAVLAAAERLNRLDELGRAVRAQVAKAMQDSPETTVFVNLHSQDLLDAQLYAPDSPLAAFGKRVVLEITERASLEGLKDIETRLKALRDLGYRLAVDDLGAGYAGLTSFTQIQPEVVKFDMSLVRGLDASASKRRLLTSMTALFRDWNIVVVAEGVETPAERDALAALGCDVLQGYLFARPARGFTEPKF
jgi:EAL domain-containing protein (putative c-di-GMP-specific phosphodiesterase class I)